MAEKRPKDSEESVRSETTILLDVEGTTTSISFVKDTLFPYVRENLKKYLDEKWDDEEFKGDLEKLKQQAKKDEEDKVTGFVPISNATPEEEKESLMKNILWQMDEDRKTGALKQLQGHMWRQAYETGAIEGHVYEDVPKALKLWTEEGKKIYIYSSGSVEAQKLLFQYSISKDLTKYLSGHFDTEIGGKQDIDSYKNILSKINVSASSVLFLTDVIGEAQAANKAGLSVVIIIREGNTCLSEEDKSIFSTITSFDELTFQSAKKRQKVETPDEKKEKEESLEKLAESEGSEKVETNGKSKIDNESNNSCELMDTTEDNLDKVTKDVEVEKTSDKLVKDVVEAEQDEKEKSKTAKLKENKAEEAADEPGEKCKALIVESKVDIDKTEIEKNQVMEVDKGSKITNADKPVDKIEKVKVVNVEETKIPDEKKESEIELKADDESKSKPESISVIDKPEVIQEKTVKAKEQESSESKITKIPEIVVDQAPETETIKDEICEIKENGRGGGGGGGGGGKVAEEAKTEEKPKVEKEVESKLESQAELSSKTSEKKEEEKEEVVEKVKEIENEKAETVTKEEEKKINGTSNGLTENEKAAESSSTATTSSQNGDVVDTPETLEAIKVKKVVDSSIADGAGEPEIPPVAVIATS